MKQLGPHSPSSRPSSQTRDTNSPSDGAVCELSPAVQARHRDLRATSAGLAQVRDNVQKELHTLPRWVGWNGARHQDGRLDKTPLNPRTAGNAQSNNPSTWADLDAACRFALQDARVGGVGLMLTDSDYWALDLDHVVDLATGQVSPSVRRFLACLTPTYTEVSPSGDGLHVLFRGRRPEMLSDTRAKDAFGPGAHLEVFGGSSPRYITMTGAVWSEDTAINEASDDTVEAVLAMFPPQPLRTGAPAPSAPLALDEEERKARRALRNVPADDYRDWIFVGMALKATLPETTARALWDEWSGKSAKYDGTTQDKHWRSFKDQGGGKTIAYVYWLAKTHEPRWWYEWQDEEQARLPQVDLSAFLKASVSSVSAPQAPSAANGVSGGTAPPASGSSVTTPQGPSSSFRPLRPLPAELLQVPEFDPALLPVSFRGWIEDIANRIQCPIDFPAVGAMVAFSALVGRRVGIRPKQHDNWLVIPNLWGGPVGRPGVMKTPGLQEPMSFLRRIESGAQVDYQKQLKEFEARQLVAKARGKQNERAIQEALKEGGDALEIAREVVATEENPPVRRRYVTNDATVEKLGELLRDNPMGILIFRDELTGLLRTLDKEGHEGARAFYLEAWNGTGAFTFDRIGRGTVEIPAAICSILGGIQPGPLAAYLRAALRSGAADDGLLQRFQLLVYPDVNSSWRNVDEFPATKQRATAWEAFASVPLLSPTSRGAESDREDSLPFFRFDLAAQEAFDAWRQRLEHQVRAGSEHPAIEAHLSKYRSLVPSLALLIHLAEARTGRIGIEAIRAAIAWAKYLEPHARRIYGLCLGNHLECRAIAKHLLNGDVEDGFAARSVYRSGWTHLDDPAAVEVGLEQLIQFGWLAEEARRTGGRHATVYRINPKIRELDPRGSDRTDRSPGIATSAAAANGKKPHESTDRTDGSSATDVDGEAQTATEPPGGTDRTDGSPSLDVDGASRGGEHTPRGPDGTDRRETEAGRASAEASTLGGGR